MTLKIGSLFSGTGALDHAVEAVTGATPSWFCEFDEAPSKILAHHWPGIPNHRDVTAVDWEQVEPVDIITGGSPCQDLSAAGRRAGMTEGTRSNLWVNMREAIAHLKPQLVVWENVLGALSAKATSDSDMEPGGGSLGDGGGGHLRALGRVLGDLTEIGYDTCWTTVRASDVGAPHHRARVFLIATPTDSERDDGGTWSSLRSGREKAIRPLSTSGFKHSSSAENENPTHPSGIGCERARTSRSGWAGSADGHNRTIEWGEYAPAIRRWERIVGPAPSPTEPNTKGKPRLAAEFASWMMGLPAGHVTGVPGLSRADQLKAIGNGVCPQQAIEALTQLLKETP